MKTLNIVIPMAGQGSRFADAGYKDPKPFIDVNGKPMIQRVIENLTPKMKHRFIFICRDEHVERLIPLIGQEDIIIPISKKTDGAAATVMLAREYIDNRQPLLIANCDQLVDFDLNFFLGTPSDANLATFKSRNPHHSYAMVDADGYVVKVAEKKVISDHAIAGLYYVKHGDEFVDCCWHMMHKEIRYKGEYYISPVFNELISGLANVSIHEVPKENCHMLGTPEELEAYLALRTV